MRVLCATLTLITLGAISACQPFPAKQPTVSCPAAAPAPVEVRPSPSPSQAIAVARQAGLPATFPLPNGFQIDSLGNLALSSVDLLSLDHGLKPPQ
jgi:hypothetical protein